MITWLKKLQNIVAHYTSDIVTLHRRITQLETMLRDRTDISMDISCRKDPNYVIMVGRYKNVDYVQTYSFAACDFEALIKYCNSIKKQGVIKVVDAPPIFRAVVSRELKGFVE